MGWGSTLGGIGGGIAGFAATGGNPMGAMAGYQAGSKIGGALGGQGDTRLAGRDTYNLPGYQQAYDQYGQLAGGAQGRMGNQQFRNDQTSLGHLLASEARGQGIGQQVVRMQAAQSADRAAQQQLGMAAAARPGGQGMAFRNAMMNSANAQSQVGGQAALAGGQMALGAQGQYAQFLHGARGQDLQQGDQNDRYQMEMLRQRLAAQQAQQQGGIAYGSAKLQTPTSGEQLSGAISGAATMYGNYQAGRGALGA